jgi:hypothetical protein
VQKLPDVPWVFVLPAQQFPVPLLPQVPPWQPPPLPQLPTSPPHVEPFATHPPAVQHEPPVLHE